MYTRIEELVSEHGLVLPSPDTEEYWLLDTMDRQQVLDIVTISVTMSTPMDVPLRCMLRLTPSLMLLAGAYRFKMHISTALTSLASDARNSSSMQESPGSPTQPTTE